MVEVDHIVKDYANGRAVDNISFTLEKGKIYGFLGPNGAGKSTTMNIMTGYLAATSGTVRINGHDILTDAAQAKKDIGFLPEIPPVIPDLTVTEYLQYAAKLKNIPSRNIRDSIARSLQMTGLGAVSKRLIQNLSKGYRQRAGLAGALVGLPEIIILDEPTVGLDPQQMIDIRNLISSLRENHTVVLSSHILSEVSSVCDELIIISHGRKVAEGTPARLEEEYCTSSDILLSTLSDPDEALSVLRGIDGITVTLTENSHENVLDHEVLSAAKHINGNKSDFRIETGNVQGIQEEIARTLCKADIPIVSMHRRRQSLEEVFLNVTADGKDHKVSDNTRRKLQTSSVKESHS